MTVPPATHQNAHCDCDTGLLANHNCESASSSIYSSEIDKDKESIPGTTPANSIRSVRVTVKPTETYADRIATADQLVALKAAHPLDTIRPTKDRSVDWPFLRYVTLSFYRRLMVLVICANVAVLGAMIARACRTPGAFTYAGAATATGANLVAAILMRQEHCINMLFHLALLLPHTTPLAVRRSAAKIAYNNGGIHAGAGISAMLWYVFYTVLVIKQFDGSKGEYASMIAVTTVTILLLILIICLAHPVFRQRHHDLWELSHRYFGYAAIGCVWAQMLISAIAASNARDSRHTLSHELVTTPVFWFLVIITICFIYPYLWLRRLPVEAHQLSSHATELRFHNRNVECCVGTRLSHNPLTQNHGFATIAHPRPADGNDAEKGYSVVISNAGDWTKKMILDPPTHIWQKGAPTIGVMRLAELFKPIVIVATGSGIGPVTSFLNKYPHHPKRVLWSARWPEQTYQTGLIRNVLAADPEAIIIDTKKTGPPNLAALTYALVKEIDAEAVMIISNPKATREVVFEMEARKIVAFGAIFDS
ncbi:hypothetical protein EJ03DRAFT_264090 [Teratosphaeria nubilosa]|uniref:Integral membrane protein TmpA n=1 Tax=Teratosphaeria nubilosa TaxID=161662 RepID=A0A6G1LM69_9PEZI|nr:hypothetical protein EJ03DRAFT_264090 [Teratosphaeria nubilosa]